MNSDTKYLVMNGTYYDAGTLPEVINVLEKARETRTRLAVSYDYDVTERGYIGRSCGPVKAPLLIKTSRSLGGDCIMTQHIVKISESRGGKVLWQK